MRFVLQIKMPNEPFNSMVRDGSGGTKIKRILEDLKPEAVYFSAYGGQRGAIMIVDLKDASEIPRYAEPFFLTFGAKVEFHIAMTPDDLERGGLDALGKKWA